MIRSAEFTVEVPAPPEKVRAVLADPTQLPRLHPLIERVTQKGRITQGTVTTTDFEVFERVPLMFPWLKVPNTYWGQVRDDAADPAHVEMLGRAVPGIRIEIRYTLQATAGGTAVHESLRYQAPVLIMLVLSPIIRRAHRATLDQLAASLRGPG